MACTPVLAALGQMRQEDGKLWPSWLQSKDLAETKRGRGRGSGKREEDDEERRETKEHILIGSVTGTLSILNRQK